MYPTTTPPGLADMSTTTTITHPDGTSISTTTTTVGSVGGAAGSGKPSDLKLYYWNGRGLMEVPRMLL